MNTIKLVFLLASMTGILVVVGSLAAGRLGALGALIVAAVMNFGSYWYSDSLILKMYNAREISETQAPEVYAAVQNLAARAQLPMPKVYTIPEAAPNAFATGRNEQHAAVAVTDGIVKILNREELEGVIAHELSHIKNRDTLIASITATMAGAIVMMATVAKWGALFGSDTGEGSSIGAIVTAVIAPIAATIVQMAVSRSREYLADEGGALVAGSPNGLASALGKLAQASRTIPLNANPSTAHLFIVNPLADSFVMNLFSTHPPVEKRIARLLKYNKKQNRDKL
jgi:heat shock protein HtpX